ncbi:MAG: FtsX-like permease family protein [Oscillospiraceae bacterium]
MVSAIRKDFIREIKNSRNRFLSIMVLSALAVAFLSGLKATAPDMKGTGDAYLDEQHLLDIQVISTLGLTEEDVGALAAREEVSLARGAYVLDAWSGDLVSKVYSITEGVNELTVLEGRLPERADECVVDQRLLEETGLALGDSLSIVPGDDYKDCLRYEAFTIVGTVRSPYYISVERGSGSIGSGSVRTYVYLPESAFDMDYYTAAYLLVEGAEEMTAFYEEYDDYIEDVIDALEPLGKERAQLRHDEIISEAEEKITDAERELADAKAEAETELADAARELADARQELDDGWREYYDGKQKLEESYPELLAAEEELADAEKTLTEGEEEYEKGLAEYEQGLKEYQDGEAELSAAYDQLSQGQAQLDQSLAGLGLGSDFTQAEAEAAISGAKAQLAAGIAAYDAGIAAAEAVIRTCDRTISNCDAILASANPDSTLYKVTALAREQAQKQRDQAAASKAEAEAGKAGLEAQQQALAGVSGADLYAAKLELQQGWAEYNAGVRELQAAKKQLDEAAQELSDARQELDEGWAEYNDGKQQLADGWAEYNDGMAKLPEAYEKLADGEKEYNRGYRDYAAGKREAEEKIADAEKELADARRKVADIENGEWFILSRSYDPGYTGFGQDADRMANLATVFPIIFFLVAALVCLTTMTRMVEEQRTQIGLMKALGYSRWAISRKYLSYGLLPSLAGSVLGLVVGHLLFPTMIYVAYQIMYEMPNLQLRFYPTISLWATLAAVACTTLSTLVACLATLGDSPANLMRPRAPKPGKRVLLERITPVWRRMSFNWKITTRNLLRYQKRFWMTVVGIGGCTALIIAGFGLRGSLMVTMERQFGELLLYDSQVTLASGLLESERTELYEYLEVSGWVEDYVELYAANVTAESEAYSTNSYLQVMEAGEIGAFVVTRDCESKEPLTLPDDGVLIDQKLSELLDLEVGDSFVVSGDGRHEVTVAGIYENYVAHFIYMTPAYYEKVFGTAAKENSLLLDLAEGSEEDYENVMTELLALHGVSSASRTSETRETYLSSMERVDFVVVVIILCAAALAIVVLYNLSNINITERVRELATIKVLGFFDPEVTAYVTRENVVLTLAGILFGCAMGKYLHIYLVHSVEIDLMMFGRELGASSYLWAALLTTLFATAVNLIAHGKMKKIDMVESLKSAE